MSRDGPLVGVMRELPAVVVDHEGRDVLKREREKRENPRTSGVPSMHGGGAWQRHRIASTRSAPDQHGRFVEHSPVTTQHSHSIVTAQSQHPISTAAS